MNARHVEVWVRGWSGDEPAKLQEGITASIGCRLFIDEEEIKNVISVKTKMSYDFTTLLIEMVAADFNVRTVTEDEWQQEHWAPTTAKNAAGKVVASTEG